MELRKLTPVEYLTPLKFYVYCCKHKDFVIYFTGFCLACADRRCASCKQSIGECDKCFPGFSMTFDAKNKTKECVRHCPEGHFKKTVDGMDLCKKNSEKGSYFLLVIILEKTKRL